MALKVQAKNSGESQPEVMVESQPEVVMVSKIKLKEYEQTISKLTKMLGKAGSKLDNVIDDRNRLKAKVAEHERLAE